MSDNKNTKKEKSNTPIIKRVVANKTSPADKMKVELVQDKRLGEYARSFFGTSKGTTEEVLFHRPVGITKLDIDDWVISDVGTTDSLIARAKDPNAERLAADRSKYVNEKLIALGLLEEDCEGALVYPGTSTSRGEYFQGIKDSWKGKGKEKFNLAAAISNAPESIERKTELEIRNKIGAISEDAVKKFPTTYETMGGPRKDIPQRAPKWAKGLSLEELTDTVIQYGVNGPPDTDIGVGASANQLSPEIQAIIDPTKSGMNNPDQWCFLPTELDKTVKKDLKATLIKGRGLLPENGEDYVFAVFRKGTNS